MDDLRKSQNGKTVLVSSRNGITEYQTLFRWGDNIRHCLGGLILVNSVMEIQSWCLPKMELPNIKHCLGGLITRVCDEEARFDVVVVVVFICSFTVVYHRKLKEIP